MVTQCVLVGPRYLRIDSILISTPWALLMEASSVKHGICPSAPSRRAAWHTGHRLQSRRSGRRNAYSDSYFTSANGIVSTPILPEGSVGTGSRTRSALPEP